MYDTPEELLREILAGEDSFLDYKEVVRKGDRIHFVGDQDTELAKDLTCFANTEGGVIVFGVRKDRERVGIPQTDIELLLQLIVNVAQNDIEPPLGHLLVFDRVLLPNSSGTPTLCLKLEIKKALYSLHAPTGRRPYWRIADYCHEMKMEQVARALERKGMMTPFEERPVFSAKVEDIESDRFRGYYQARFGAFMAEPGGDYERLLLNLKLAVRDEAGGLRPTALGLLFFSSRPDGWISGAYVDIAAYDTDVPDAARQRDAKSVRGTIVEQIEGTLAYLHASPFNPVAAMKDGLGRVDLPAYSPRALQEAVVNALVHRDYGIAGAQVRVFLFPDRIEVCNPGRLHNTLLPEHLFAGCQPVRRNQMLAGFLREYTSPITNRAYMEGRGEGFLAMVRECERTSGRRPALDVIGDSVKVTIWRAPTAPDP